LEFIQKKRPVGWEMDVFRRADAVFPLLKELFLSLTAAGNATQRLHPVPPMPSLPRVSLLRCLGGICSPAEVASGERSSTRSQCRKQT